MKQNLITTHSFCSLDQIIAQQSVSLLSLNPHKNLMTSFTELGSLIFENTTDIQLISAIQKTLESIVYAQMQNFPENLFWDFDFMVSNMLKQALLKEHSAVEFLESFGEKMVLLTQMFGINTDIHFRYVHDFIYGFEWARWVQKDPQNRADIAPFDLIFLDYLLNKGKELLQRISLNEVTYYKLSDTGYRNPFTFSREPEDERLLLTSLAKEQLIPVAAWNWNAQPVWNKPFQQMREELSLKLNIRQQTT
ncbi:hypothetical protein NIES4074_34140 [Cylindrospermum sp. NIES-4074]|nr:hypothetical protein NIES4074_34140 [Cylindrospermum sp. NIES-4074]